MKQLIKAHNEWGMPISASDEDMMVKKYLQRSMWHNERIYQQVIETGDTYIKITKDLTEKNLLKKAIELLG